MSLSLTNRDDIIANSYSLITSTGAVVDLLEAVQSSIVGLPPPTLNTIEKLSNAISNDPNYFTTMQTAINGKVSTATLTSTVETINTSIGGKQTKFTTQTIPSNTGRLFELDTTKIRAINVASPLSIATPNSDYLTISCDSYTKAQTDSKISDLVGAAPALLNTLSELSDALGDDHNYAATITTALAAKAPLNDANLTGLTTINDLKVAVGVSTDSPLGLVLGGVGVSTFGGLTVNGNVLATGNLTINGTIAGHAPSFTGDVLIMETAVPGQIQHAFRQTGLSEIGTELQVSGDIASSGTVWSQGEACLTGFQAYTKGEVNTALNSKANTSDVYTKTQLDASSAAWSSGLAGGYHYLETGTDALVIRTPTGAISANFLGSVGGAADDGRIIFYKGVSGTSFSASSSVSAASAQITNNCTAGSLTVSGDLLIGTTTVVNVRTALADNMATVDAAAAFALTAPLASPVLTGTATAVNLTVSGALLAGTTNVLTTLNAKANTLDTYTKTQAAGLFQPLISSFGSPLRSDLNILSGTTTLSIETTAALVIGNIDSSGNLAVGGNLTVSGFLSAKPYVSLKIITTGGTPSTVLSGVTTIGTPGTMAVSNLGYTSSITSARGTVGASNAFLYTFTWATAHPLGSTYAVMCNFQGSSTSNASPNGFFRATGTSTNITVWIRTSDGIIKDENFYVYTVP